MAPEIFEKMMRWMARYPLDVRVHMRELGHHVHLSIKANQEDVGRMVGSGGVGVAHLSKIAGALWHWEKKVATIVPDGISVSREHGRQIEWDQDRWSELFARPLKEICDAAFNCDVVIDGALAPSIAIVVEPVGSRQWMEDLSRAVEWLATTAARNHGRKITVAVIQGGSDSGGSTEVPSHEQN